MLSLRPRVRDGRRHTISNACHTLKHSCSTRDRRTESLFHNECHSFNFGKDLNMHRNNYRKNCFLLTTPVRAGKALGLLAMQTRGPEFDP